MATDKRVDTYCDECRSVDSDPKHHVYDINDGRFESHHLDCGAVKGCGVCAESEGLTGGARYDELVKIVASPKHGDALAGVLGAATPNVEGL